jgi:hypothetical protein
MTWRRVKTRTEQDESKKAFKGQVTFKGMEMLCRGDSRAMTINTGEKDKYMAGSQSKADKSSKLEENEFKLSEDDMRREGAALTARMEEVLLDLKDTDSDDANYNTPDPHTDDEDGEDYKVDD